MKKLLTLMFALLLFGGFVNAMPIVQKEQTVQCGIQIGTFDAPMNMDLAVFQAVFLLPETGTVYPSPVDEPLVVQMAIGTLERPPDELVCKSTNNQLLSANDNYLPQTIRKAYAREFDFSYNEFVI